MTKRLLITGGSSYLGRHLVPLVPDDFELIYTYFQNDPLQLDSGVQLDIREKTAVSILISTYQPTHIVHLAGSNRPDDMAAIIRKGTEHVVAGAKVVNARLIHLSTDSIFDGLNPPYDETAVPTPLNEYGRAKADAEAIVQSYTNYVIVRTSLIYGLQEMDHGTAWMSQAVAAEKSITLFKNQLRNPVWVHTLSQAILELLTHQYRGILNIAGNQVLTRAAFAIRMFDYWEITDRENVIVGNSSASQWPLDCTLDLKAAQETLITPLLGVDDVLTQAKKQQP